MLINVNKPLIENLMSNISTEQIGRSLVTMIFSIKSAHM